MEIVYKDEVKNESVPRKARIYNNFLKEDLERYYIDEKKSLNEISIICKCSWYIIKKSLEEYGIPIRPHGAFLVDDGGETLKSKYNKGEISSVEYGNKIAKERGFNDHNDYTNELVKNKGFKDINDYNRKMGHKRGERTGLSMSENKECSMYLGVHIAERILPLLFKNVKKMPTGNPGYDFICDNGYKIESKSACLKDNNIWTFKINKNKVADYFFMIAFDDRENLKVMHIWLVKGDTVIEKTTCNSEEFIFNEKNVINIGKGNKALKRWIKYEKTDMLKKAQILCNKYKESMERL